MIVVTLAGGVFFLTPGDYATGARSAIRAVLSVSNIFFYKHTGYFDQAAELQPMLHTWSLGVEEQFYLVWPLLLLAIFMMTRGKRQIIAGICACLALGSFVWSLDLMNANPKAVFYLAHARSWELGAGALVAIAPRRWFRCHPGALVLHLYPIVAVLAFCRIASTPIEPAAVNTHWHGSWSCDRGCRCFLGR